MNRWGDFAHPEPLHSDNDRPQSRGFYGPSQGAPSSWGTRSDPSEDSACKGHDVAQNSFQQPCMVFLQILSWGPLNFFFGLGEIFPCPSNKNGINESHCKRETTKIRKYDYTWLHHLNHHRAYDITRPQKISNNFFRGNTTRLIYSKFKRFLRSGGTFEQWHQKT